MEKRDTSSYKVIFEKLKALLPKNTISNCMSDYEAATRKAVREVFPTARMSGCYFHYVQAVVKKFKKYGMKDDDNFKEVREQVCALALLPNEKVIEGFELISQSIKRSERWTRFSAYWMRTWSKANISVYGLKDRTNNFSETLNKTVNQLIKSRHPNIWTLISNLRKVEDLKSIELEKVGKGLMPQRKVNTKTSLGNLDDKIKKATEKFEQTGKVKDFLRRVTYNVSAEVIFEVEQRIGRFEGDYSSDDDSDEEFIPNDYDERRNFRKTKKRKSNADEHNRTKKKR